jgi:hypothetical protein
LAASPAAAVVGRVVASAFVNVKSEAWFVEGVSVPELLLFDTRVRFLDQGSCCVPLSLRKNGEMDAPGLRGCTRFRAAREDIPNGSLD